MNPSRQSISRQGEAQGSGWREVVNAMHGLWEEAHEGEVACGNVPTPKKFFVQTKKAPAATYQDQKHISTKKNKAPAAALPDQK